MNEPGYEQFDGQWQANAQLALDAIDMRPTRGIPAWLIHVMVMYNRGQRQISVDRFNWRDGVYPFGRPSTTTSMDRSATPKSTFCCAVEATK